MIVVECVGGPMDGQRVEARFPEMSMQPAWTGPFFGRHQYRLIDGRYVYNGIAAVRYGESAGDQPVEFKPPDYRRRR